MELLTPETKCTDLEKFYNWEKRISDVYESFKNGKNTSLKVIDLEKELRESIPSRHTEILYHAYRSEKHSLKWRIEKGEIDNIIVNPKYLAEATLKAKTYKEYSYGNNPKVINFKKEILEIIEVFFYICIEDNIGGEVFENNKKLALEYGDYDSICYLEPRF